MEEFRCFKISMIAVTAWLLAGCGSPQDPGATGGRVTGGLAGTGTTSGDATSGDTTGGAASAGATGADTTGDNTAGAEGSGSDSSSGGGSGSDGASDCEDPTIVYNGITASLAPEFASDYRFFNIGGIPGLPEDYWFGTPFIDEDDPNLLYVAARYLPDGADDSALYSIELRRNACGHIVGFEGEATFVNIVPTTSGSMVYGPGGNLYFDQFGDNSIAQLTAPDGTIQATVFPSVGSPSGGISALGFVPPSMGAMTGQLRGAIFTTREWYHVDVTPGAPFATLTNPVMISTLPDRPAQFAYVPVGSPGFPTQSMLMGLWDAQKIVAYEVDEQGDPILDTQRDFFEHFDNPWGAHFESETGDFLFVRHIDEQDDLPNSLVIVQGFVPPPEPPR